MSPYGRHRSAGAGRQVLDLYREAPWSVRLHVGVRWATCPLGAVAAQIPTTGRILDVGCGHGLLSLLLAQGSVDRQITGIDVDSEKVAVAKLAARRSKLSVACDFALMPPGEIPDGPWDAAVVADVLYLLDSDDQHGLLRSCAQRLAPDGVLVVKEMAPTPAWKATWNRVQETASVRLLRITTGQGDFTFTPPDRLAAWLTDEGLRVTHRPIHRGYPHPHYLHIATRP